MPVNASVCGVGGQRRSNEIFGAAHAFDRAFVFGNFAPSLYANIEFTTANESGRPALSDAMMRSVGAFARNSMRPRRRK